MLCGLEIFGNWGFKEWEVLQGTGSRTYFNNRLNGSWLCEKSQRAALFALKQMKTERGRDLPRAPLLVSGRAEDRESQRFRAAARVPLVIMDCD